MLKNLAVVAAGGALGSIVRYLLALYLNQPKWELSWGTICANLAGSFLMGSLLAWDQQRGFPEPVRIFLMVGFCGAFTTFSSFAAEAMLLAQKAKVMAFFITVGVHLIGSLLAVATAFALFQKWLTPS